MARMPIVLLIGALDTKGEEYAYVASILRREGVNPRLMDVGVLGDPAMRADVSRAEVARAADADIAVLASAQDRGDAVTTMARGATALVRELQRGGELDAVMGLGGTGGTSMVCEAMRELPVGVPKLMVSTCASGDTRPFVGAVDMTMMYSVVDIAGINQVSERILTNAAHAVAGMAWGRSTGQHAGGEHSDGRLVGATMFGNTTPCVTAARKRLETLGYEILTFHATGIGGESMETLMRDGFVTGALDITTTELASEVVGGTPWAAAPGRLEVASALGLPQVVSLGCLDMATFGPPETVPERLRTRLTYRHNAVTTLMRTTRQECEEVAHRLASKLNGARFTSLMVPLRGFSIMGTGDQPFRDPETDRALIDALRAEIDPGVEWIELDVAINEPSFAEAVASAFHQNYESWLASRVSA